MADAELDRIARFCAEATVGPWKSCIEGRDCESGSTFIQTGAEDIYLAGATDYDHDFIADARQSLPLLVAEVRRLRAMMRIIGI